MAGRPSRVAGILIIAFGRLTFSHSSTACFSVFSVSWARRGSTSMETRPSTKSVASAISRKMSVALRTSVVVSSRTAVSTSTLPSSLSWASYGPTWLRAFWKMDGLVVTPTTFLSLMSSCREPDSIRVRDRSSSQIETPLSDVR